MSRTIRSRDTNQEVLREKTFIKLGADATQLRRRAGECVPVACPLFSFSYDHLVGIYCRPRDSAVACLMTGPPTSSESGSLIDTLCSATSQRSGLATQDEAEKKSILRCTRQPFPVSSMYGPLPQRSHLGQDRNDAEHETCQPLVEKQLKVNLGFFVPSSLTKGKHH